MDINLLPLFLALFWIFSGLTAYLLFGKVFYICNFEWTSSNQSAAALIALAGPAALMAGLCTLISIPNMVSLQTCPARGEMNYA